jgi:MFS family permease
VTSTAVRPNRRPLYGVLTSFAMSLTGTRVAGIALPWFVLVLTDSPSKTGLLALCEMGPYVVSKALGGPVVDALGPRRVSITLDCLSAVVIGLVPLMWALGVFSLPALLVVAAVFGAVRGPGDSAKEIFIPDVAELAQMPLARVTGLTGSIERLAGTVGPALAGALVALFGPVPSLAITSVAAAMSAACIGYSTRHLRPHHETHVDSDESGYLSRLRGGFRFVNRDRLLRAAVLMIACTNFLDAALSAVLVPVWAKSSGAGPAGIGLLGTAVGVSALLGSLCATVVAERLPRQLVFLCGFLIGGAPRFLVLALGLPFPVVVAVWVVSGFGLGFLNPILGALFFERVPKHLLGRVNAIGDSMAWSLIPFGGLAAAATVAVIGLSPAILVAGVAYLVATTLPGLRPEWKEMDRRPAADSQGESTSQDSAHHRAGDSAKAARGTA